MIGKTHTEIYWSTVLTGRASIEVDKAEQAVSDLTILVESRDWPSTPGDAPLVAGLMSVLSNLLAKRQSVKEGVEYLEQEILAAILTQVEKISVSDDCYVIRLVNIWFSRTLPTSKRRMLGSR